MKSKIVLAFAALAVLLLASGCSQWELPYKELDKTGYTVSVKYDINGGRFAGTGNVTVVDTYDPTAYGKDSDGNVNIPLIAPDNKEIRNDSAYEISRTGYFFAGWYRERALRTDENGNALDAYGVPVSESGREQGYIYNGRWDFESDTLNVPADGAYSSENPELTLYAAWIPYYVFEFYAVDPESGQWELIGTRNDVTEVTVPVWNEKTGKLDMNEFIKRDGMTADKVFYDEEMTQPVTGTVTGSIDYERGISATESVKLYTTWLEGTWYRIYTAEQLYKNSTLTGCYLLMADIDFSDSIWSGTLASGVYNGTFDGNGHTVSNITVLQGDVQQYYGGLFGSLGENACVKNVTFENVSYTMEAGSRMAGAAFGLFAGTVSDSARVENLNISGTFTVSEGCYPASDYSIGLFSGDCKQNNTDITGISASATGDKISLAVEEDGRVTLTFND